MTAIIEYSKTEAALADLAARYKGIVFEVETVKGMDAAKRARAELRDYRVSLEAKRVEIKAPALERCRLIDAEAKRITASLVALEDPVDAQIKAQEARRDAEKREKERLEAERIAAEERAKKEAEEARLAAERAKLAKEREEFERQQASVRAQEAAAAKARMEAEEKERAARRAEEEKLAAERRKIEEERASLERAKVEKELAEKRAAEESARKEREAQEAKAKAERAAKEAAEREEARKLNERSDAHEMLHTFVARFGHLEEFAAIVKAVRTLQLQAAKAQKKAA